MGGAADREARGEAGSSSDPQPLSRAISELIALRGLAGVQGRSQLQAAWAAAAGPDFAAGTRVLAIRRGVLEIGVNSAPLLSELQAFHKQSLLEELQQKHAQFRIRDLRFRLKSDATA